MRKPSTARYRTTNWSSYTASLRNRGSLLIWLDKEMTWLASHDGKPGRPEVFSDAAIQFCLTIKVLFKLPLRQATGMVSSLLKKTGLDWAVPDYTTLCRRQKTLAVQTAENPDTHRPLEPLLGRSEGRDHSRGLNSTGKGAIMPRARVLQQRPARDQTEQAIWLRDIRLQNGPWLPALACQIL